MECDLAFVVTNRYLHGWLLMGWGGQRSGWEREGKGFVIKFLVSRSKIVGFALIGEETYWRWIN